MQRRSIGIGVAATVFLVAGWWAWWTLRPSPPDPPPPAALLELASIDVTDRPLDEVLAELSVRHRVPIRLDTAAWQNTGLMGREPVTLRLDGVTLHSLLNVLLRRWTVAAPNPVVVDENGTIVLSTLVGWYRDQAAYVARAHPLPELATRSETLDDLSYLAATHALRFPHQALGPFVPDNVDSIPGGLMVRARQDVHRTLEDVFAGLAEIHRRQDQQYAEAVSQPLETWMVGPNYAPGNARILAALERRVTGTFTDQPLEEVLSQLSREQGIPIVLQEPIGERRVSLSFTKERLEDVLASLVGGGQNYSVEVADEVVEITRFLSPVPQLRLYPIGDLSDYAGSDDCRRLTRMLGSVWAVKCGGALIVAANPRGHRDVERRLATFRQILRDDEVSPSVGDERWRGYSLRKLREPTRRSLQSWEVSEYLANRFAGVRSLERFGDLFLVEMNDDTHPKRFETLFTTLQRMQEQPGGPPIWITDIDPDKPLEGSLVRCYDVSRLQQSPHSLRATQLVAVAHQCLGNATLEIHALPGVLLVSTDYDSHGRLAGLLEGLNRLRERPDELKPVWTDLGFGERGWSIAKQLERRVDVLWENVTLPEALRQFAKLFGQPVAQITSAEEAPADSDETPERFHLALWNAPLRDVLEVLPIRFRQDSLVCDLDTGTAEFTRLYPVGDLRRWLLSHNAAASDPFARFAPLLGDVLYPDDPGRQSEYSSVLERMGEGRELFASLKGRDADPLVDALSKVMPHGPKKRTVGDTLVMSGSLSEHFALEHALGRLRAGGLQAAATGCRSVVEILNHEVDIPTGIKTLPKLAEHLARQLNLRVALDGESNPRTEIVVAAGKMTLANAAATWSKTGKIFVSFDGGLRLSTDSASASVFEFHDSRDLATAAGTTAEAHVWRDFVQDSLADGVEWESPVVILPGGLGLRRSATEHLRVRDRLDRLTQFRPELPSWSALQSPDNSAVVQRLLTKFQVADDVDRRVFALALLASLRHPPPELGVLVAERLAKADARTDPREHWRYLQALRRLGPAAAAAVPALGKCLDRAAAIAYDREAQFSNDGPWRGFSRPLVIAYLETLVAIGPPALTELESQLARLSRDDSQRIDMRTFFDRCGERAAFLVPGLMRQVPWSECRSTLWKIDPYGSVRRKTLDEWRNSSDGSLRHLAEEIDRALAPRPGGMF